MNGRAFGRTALLFLALAATMVLSAGRAGAEDDDGILDDPGPGWSTVDCATRSVDLPGAHCFGRGLDLLVISALAVEDGADARSREAATASASGLGPVDLDAADGKTFGNTGASGALVQVATSRHIFLLQLVTGTVPPDEVMASALDIARRQQAHDGGAPPRAPTSTTTVPGSTKAGDAALDRWLVPASRVPPLQDLGTTSLDSEVESLRAKARSSRVVDLLGGAPQRVRLFAAPSGMQVGVSLTRQPFAEFAAIGLGAAEDAAAVTERREVAGVPGGVAVRRRDGIYAVTFRRGPYMAIVTGTVASSSQRQAMEAAVDRVARAQAEQLPSGGTSAYRFPSTTRSIVLTMVLTTLLCALPLVASRVRRRGRRTTAAAVAANAPARPSAVLDVDRQATRLRRQGLLLVVGQIVAVNLVVIGALGMFGMFELHRGVGPALVAIGLVGGLGYTSWRARVELRAGYGAGAPAHGDWRSPLSLVGGLIAVATLVAGVALVAVSAGGLAFGPSLALLERSKQLDVGPGSLSLLTLVGGVLLLFVGAAAVRLSRIWARSSAATRRQRDHRPPVLYLRSFEDDRLRLPAVLTARRPFLELFLARGADPFEEAVSWELAPHGPVVAVGRPGRPLSSLGAARDRLPDDSWQQGVADRMAEAAVIVVVVGATDGLRWELGALARGGHLAKTLLVFPPLDDDVLAGRWQYTTGVLAELGTVLEPMPAPVGRVLVAIVEGTVPLVTVAECRDEASYRVAIDAAVRVCRGRRAAEPVGPAPVA